MIASSLRGRGRLARLGLRSAVAIGVILLFAMPAAAQKSAADAAVADAMFRAGRELMDAGKYTEACKKLEGSYQLEPAGGTLLNLALCHELQGRVATAWLEFQQATADAIRDKREDRERFAQAHMAALQPRLPKVAVQVESPVAGLTVRLGDIEIPAASLGLELPFDPGSYRLIVQAPGFQTSSRTVVAKEGDRLQILVPPLQRAPASVESGERPVPLTQPSPNSDPPTKDEGSSALRTSAWVGGAAGVALVGVGSYFGVRALQKKADADEDCGPDSCNSALGSSLDKEAHDAAIKANLLIGGGVILTGLATFTLLWTAEDEGGRNGASTMSGASVGVAPSGGILASYRGRW